MLDAIGDQTVDEGSTLSFTATASDPDQPANTLTFSLAGRIAGRCQRSTRPRVCSAGRPSEAPAGSTVHLRRGRQRRRHRPTPRRSPSRQRSQRGPGAGPDRRSGRGRRGTADVHGQGQRQDLPANTLTYSLSGGPGGRRRSRRARACSPGRPPKGTAAARYTFDVRSATARPPTAETITVTVNEVNAAPVLAARSVTRASTKAACCLFTATATDSDDPAGHADLQPGRDGPGRGGDHLRRRLHLDAHRGPRARAATRSTWSSATARPATPRRSPSRSTKSIWPRRWTRSGPETIDEGSTLSFTATASDADLPANTLTFSLAAAQRSGPAGATIDPARGAFSWTPSEAWAAPPPPSTWSSATAPPRTPRRSPSRQRGQHGAGAGADRHQGRGRRRTVDVHGQAPATATCRPTR